MIRITLQEVVAEILLTCDGMAVSQVKMRTLLPAVVCFMHPSRWPEIGRKDYIDKHVSIGIDVENIFLENLLPNCKVLNINTPKKQKVPKETNWKQKFQKPQNENICLTYLNTEMNGNFHFLSFCAAFLKVQNQVL